ncbi:MAG: hypothetical protein E5299_01098 [Burkholderia gladioli]|nr:MAG: hypothetical protein E5299_01098 [Burkholderia gladioli]
MLQYQRQQEQPLLFDQVNEIKLAQAHNYIDFIVFVEGNRLRFLFGCDAPQCY